MEVPTYTVNPQLIHGGRSRDECVVVPFAVPPAVRRLSRTGTLCASLPLRRDTRDTECAGRGLGA